MQYIDPQLLAADASMQLDQAEPESYTDLLQNDNPFPYYPASPEHFDFASAYPEEPLNAIQSMFQPNFYDTQLFMAPTYTEGPLAIMENEFQRGFFLNSQPPSFAPPEFLSSYEDSSTQTDEPGRALVAPVQYSKYSLRTRKGQGPNLSGLRNVSQSRAQKRVVLPQRKIRAPRPLPEGKGLDEPLSTLAATLPHIPEVDMDTFVSRNRDERIFKGKITRPSNAFMLYRHAYCKYARALLSIHHNADISRVIGASWRQESEEVKSRFFEYAFTEKAVHTRHFPKYTYAPGKSNMAEY
ncbi:hypothetical protein E0Z10_g4077 [Xylaria hypoxylon]|uniref:HMG box domain-containing protein n=1 Tax=Xylaria hypoxylon TaxID=37992 RepID=A0A4Z0YZP6_9PEZI|nr:hypothetical protein E0Z10_g4077 [Xylaria hypoxylon]